MATHPLASDSDGFDRGQIHEIVRQLLEQVGEDPDREGLVDTPRRVADMYAELTSGYRRDPWELIGNAIFNVDYDSMVVVKDIEFYSLCVHGKTSLVYTDRGRQRARDVRVGDRVWTVVGGVPTQTTVTHVFESKRNELLEIETADRVLRVTPEHPLLTTRGWVRAHALGADDRLLYCNPSTLCRDTYSVQVGYALGYVLGAVASDGCITGSPPRYVRLQVTDRSFADRFRACLETAFEGVRAQVESVWGKSGFRNRHIPMYRVRLTSSHVAQQLLQMFGGEKKTRSFRLPHVVRTQQDAMQGFLDGYIDGDGHRSGSGHVIRSANLPFLAELGEVVHSEPSRPDPTGCAGLYVSRRWHVDGWYGKGGFTPAPDDDDLLDPRVEVQPVRDIRRWVTKRKRYKVFNFECAPHASYLTNGLVAHNCEHHIVPFYGHVHVGYIPEGRVIGASKIPRVIDHFARRLQLQERMTEQIARFLEEAIEPRGLGVVAEGIHLCMAMRGVQKQDTRMVTSAMTGAFRKDPKTRTEFLQFIDSRVPS